MDNYSCEHVCLAFQVLQRAAVQDIVFLPHFEAPILDNNGGLRGPWVNPSLPWENTTRARKEVGPLHLEVRLT